MKYNKLGRENIVVAELCFGALPMGPLQKDLPVKEQKDLILQAVKGGINFIDTAQLYNTYEPIGRAVMELEETPVIASKSTASTYEEMKEAVKEALALMRIDKIDIFHLHAARVEADVFAEREGALQYLIEAREKDIIEAVGISSHSVPVVEKAALIKAIDVVFPILNKIGMGIIDGDKEDMEAAIKKCKQKGKGIYLMKALAGGNLIDEFNDAMSYARSISGSASIAVGMVSPEELEYNISYFSGESVEAVPTFEKYEKKVTVIEGLCQGCGTCIEYCPNEALAMKGDTAVIDEQLCLTCGYCVQECPEFAIRVI